MIGTESKGGKEAGRSVKIGEVERVRMNSWGGNYIGSANNAGLGGKWIDSLRTIIFFSDVVRGVCVLSSFSAELVLKPSSTEGVCSRFEVSEDHPFLGQYRLCRIN